MGKNVTQKLIETHLKEGSLHRGSEIALKIDQTLTQDATGTMVMLEFEAMGKEYVTTELSAQYIDHNLLQTDFKNADDHLFLKSACKKFGIWYSFPGNGVSHPVHMERFGQPGKTLLGSDSHSCAAGSLGMLAIGAGGLEVAIAMAGKPFYLTMPEIWGIELTGRLPDWVSAKDIILEMLRRHDVDGGVGKILEYFGPGLEHLSAMDRHVIANMGAELGATSTVFPSDRVTHQFLRQQERAEDWQEIIADKDASYDDYEHIDLSTLVPLIACPSSPGNVKPVEEVAGREIYQAMIGSSANPGIRDFAVPALVLQNRKIHENVSLDINPTSRQVLEYLANNGFLGSFIRAGARIHQSGCNGCIGMGQAPASGRISLRTVPRNFPGRSGTKEDQVYLCSPETAVVSALNGRITDPRTMEIPYPDYSEPEKVPVNTKMLLAPIEKSQRAKVKIEKGPNIKPLPEFEPLKDKISGEVLLKLGDDISTDEILPAGSKVLPYRSNIEKISEFVFDQIDETFSTRAKSSKNSFFIVAGKNYGQGSSREHAAIAPRYLGLKVILAKSFARIHYQNLANFGILPLQFKNDDDWSKIKNGDLLILTDVKEKILGNQEFTVVNETENVTIDVEHHLSDRQIKYILDGSLINSIKI